MLVLIGKKEKFTLHSIKVNHKRQNKVKEPDCMVKWNEASTILVLHQHPLLHVILPRGPQTLVYYSFEVFIVGELTVDGILKFSGYSFSLAFKPLSTTIWSKSISKMSHLELIKH